MRILLGITIAYILFSGKGIFFRFVDWIDPKIRRIVWYIIR